MELTSSPRRPAARVEMVAAALLLVVAILSSLNAELFTGFIAVTAFAGTGIVCRSIVQDAPIFWPLASACGAIVVIAVARSGEAGLMFSLAIALVVLSAAAVLSGLRPGAVGAVAAGLFAVLFVGFTSAFLVLIRREPDGAQLAYALWLAVVLFITAYVIVQWRLSESLGPRVVWVAPGAALAAAVLGALISSLFLPDRFRLLPLALVGLITGLGALTGDIGARFLGSQDRIRGLVEQLAFHLGPVFVAAPAFFYGYRLYLT